MEKFEKLLEPGKIGTLELKNRFVVPAMGSNYADEDGNVTDQMIAYYRERAKGGFGLIISEVAGIDTRGKSVPKVFGIWDDAHIEEVRKLTDAVHEEGGKIFIQLHHCGRQTTPASLGGRLPEAPSRIACPVNDVVPEVMSTERVREVIEEFGDAALRAKKAGADGVEVHGGHGYLIAQFMSTQANRRTDEFGGSFTGRMRFPKEIFKNIRKKVGDDILFRFR